MSVDFRFIKTETLHRIAEVIATYLIRNKDLQVHLRDIPDYIEHNFNKNLKEIIEKDKSDEDLICFDETNLKDVRFIGDYALSGWNNLQSLTLPASLGKIGNYACANAQNLKRVNTPIGNERTIGIGAFQNCSNLEAIELYGVSSIGEKAFKDCTKLSWVTLHTPTIGSEAFSGCTSLSSMITAQTIGDKAFAGCTSLTSIVLDSDNISNLGDYVFSGCSGINTVNIYGLKRIPNGTFSDCYSIKDFDIIETDSCVIGSEAFKNCNFDVIKVNTLLQNVTEIDSFAFYNALNKDSTTQTTQRNLTIPAKTELIGQYAFSNNDLSTVIFLKNSNLTIKKGAFIDNPNMVIANFATLDFIPTLETSALEIFPDICTIVVPKSLYAEWKTAPNWSDMEHRIYGS